jgi:hypothetical protein
MRDKTRVTDDTNGVFGKRRGASTTVASVADWGGANAALVIGLVRTVTSRGGAVRFGYTRDGGAYALGLYYGGEATSEYCRPSEDIDLFLQGWIEFYQDLPDRAGKSPDLGKGKA